MKQTAQVIRIDSPNYAEVKVRRSSACASAHNCGSCDHCSMMENAPEIIVKAENLCGAGVGDTVTVESSSARVLGAAVLLYIAPLILFFVGYFLGGAFELSEGGAIATGVGGFALGLFLAFILDRRHRYRESMRFQIISIEG